MFSFFYIRLKTIREKQYYDLLSTEPLLRSSGFHDERKRAGPPWGDGKKKTRTSVRPVFGRRVRRDDARACNDGRAGGALNYLWATGAKFSVCRGRLEKGETITAVIIIAGTYFRAARSPRRAGHDDAKKTRRKKPKTLKKKKGRAGEDRIIDAVRDPREPKAAVGIFAFIIRTAVMARARERTFATESFRERRTSACVFCARHADGRDTHTRSRISSRTVIFFVILAYCPVYVSVRVNTRLLYEYVSRTRARARALLLTSNASRFLYFCCPYVSTRTRRG